MRALIDSRLPYNAAGEGGGGGIEGEETMMYREMQTHEVDGRRFHRGEWVDAKDTIDQWVS
jgi:hypothetical protein